MDFYARCECSIMGMDAFERGAEVPRSIEATIGRARRKEAPRKAIQMIELELNVRSKRLDIVQVILRMISIYLKQKCIMRLFAKDQQRLGFFGLRV